ncbi:MAG: hypothetical protein KJ077_21675 [Anaerolineae bacterium]|nr:hypothetical protein [Anaerolineae bacterium]
MDSQVKQNIINEISKILLDNHPFTVEFKGHALATILPVSDYKEFQTEREEIFKNLEKELNGILDLIRSHTQHQSLAEVEAQLAALRHIIEQEMED